jgi:hypothetical protein
MSSIYVKYGIRAGGAPPFLRRTRTAVGQLQTRTRTGGNYTQRQRRTSTCQSYNYDVKYWQSTGAVVIATCYANFFTVVDLHGADDYEGGNCDSEGSYGVGPVC